MAGVLTICVFQFVGNRRSDSWWDIAGMVVIVEVFSLVALLTVMLGLRYIFGRRPWLERVIAKSLRHFILALGVLSLVLTAAVLYLWW